MKTLTALAGIALIAMAGLTATVPTASARGFHHWHHGYHHYYHRHYYGGGFGLGLLSGALIGGAVAAPYYDYPPTYVYRRYPPRRAYYYPRRYYAVHGVSRAHVRWCYAHYRSYRASDNTFQPYHGPRQACVGPY